MSMKSSKSNKRYRPVSAYIENPKNNKISQMTDINTLEGLSLDEEGSSLYSLKNLLQTQSFYNFFFFSETATSSNSKIVTIKINKNGSSQHTQASSSKGSLIRGASTDEDKNDDDPNLNNSDEIEAIIQR